MDRDEIKAVYDRGPDAVIELVEHLFAIIQQQQLEIARLTERVNELEARLNTDSHNSNKPPSSDSFKKKSRSLRPTSNRKPGAQGGHEPHSLRQVDNPDRVIIHQVSECLACNARLEDVAVNDYHCRQVFDLPPLKLEVTEHRVEIKLCPDCHSPCQAQFPDQVSNLAQYGEGIKSFAVYLMNYQLLPYRRAREIVQDLLGQPVAEGTLQSALEECYQGLDKTEELIGRGVVNSQLAHFDETGMRVEGKLRWLHVASTSTLTHYANHRKRGRVASEEINILPRFEGRAIHDGMRSYMSYSCKHGLCNAHQLRELTFLEEEQSEKWASEMKSLLVEIKHSVEKAAEEARTALSLVEIKEFEDRYDRIIERGLRAERLKPRLATGKRGPKKQSKGKNLLDRLMKYRGETLAFMYDFRAPFDNNQAERDLRMMKVKQKISGSFRREEGANRFCRIRGYISTMRKQGHNALMALKSVFAGRPIVPVLSG